jgi:hypothetical protein
VNRALAWSGVAVSAVLVVAFAAMFQVSSCADAALGEGESVCTTGPAVGVPALWAVVVIGAVVVLVAVWRAVVAIRVAGRPGER